MRLRSLLFITLIGLGTAPSRPVGGQPPGGPFPTLESPAAEATDSKSSEAAPAPAVGGEAEEEEDSSGAPALQLPQTREEIEQEVARLKDLNLSESDREQTAKFLQDALQATAEFERLAEERAKAEAEYREQPDDYDSGGPQENTPDWYTKRLAMEVPFILKPKTSDLQNDPLPELTERAARLEEYVNKWANTVSELESAPATRKQWLNSLPQRELEIEQQLATTREEMAKIDGEGGSSPVRSARRLWLAQREARLLAEQLTISAKKGAIQRGEALYSLELELAKRKAEFYRTELAWLRKGISERRQQEANRQAEVAQQEVDANRQLIERYPDIVGALAKENQKLTADQQVLAKAIDEALAQRTSDANLLQEVTSRFEPIKAQFEADERLSQASGQLLRDERNRLPSLPKLRTETERTIEARNDISFRRFQATQQLVALENIESQVAKLARNIPARDRQQAEIVIRNLLERQREYLDGLVRGLSELEAQLGSLIATKELLRVKTREFRDFIAERDLWIRSSEPMHYFDATHFWGALKWSLAPQNWLQAGEELAQAAERRPNRAVGGVGLFLLLMLGQREARRRLGEVGREAAKKTCVEFFPTLRALWLTVIVGLPWPVLLWSLGWLLDGPLVEGEFTRALSLALRSTAWYLLLAEVLRHCCRPDGLAEGHLNWPRAPLGQALRILRFVPFTLIPILFWSTGLDVQTIQPFWSASLGRGLYIGGLALVAATMWRVFYTKSSPTYQSLHRAADNWLLRLHGAWRPLFLLIPLALSVMAWIGYYYTAQQLTLRVVVSGIMLVCLMLAAGLWRRWLLVTRRRLAREQARQRRAQSIAAAEAAAASAEGEAIPPMAIAEFAEETVDLTALSEQSRKLLQMILFVTGAVGVVLIWQDIFPALAWLDRHALPWVDPEVVNPTTWGNVLRSLLACVIAYVVVRDVPGLLELLVLPHLPLDQGARYAIATLVRYALLIVGIVVAANLLGITGTSISWLVAAMGVGLGFGLQEIFANFVSGIILLFERPIRVGDIITLGDKTGVVSRIRMRATTITDWDRKEYVVPNKDLVTERLLNWTLSDPTNRVTVNVGVAYGSDTELACQLLCEAAAECTQVLKEPAPVAVFEQFGASTLNLSLRCFLPDLEKRLDTIHRLHTTIDQKFKAARLELAFPHLDINLRSAPPLEWSRHVPGTTNNGASDPHPRATPKGEHGA